MTITEGAYSHTEGQYTVVLNIGEHAQGINNMSYTGSDDKDITLHTIGNGKDVDNRSNAIQVMRNGDTYITGIGGFDGTNYKNANTIQTEIKKISDLKSQIILMSMDNLKLFKTVQYLSEQGENLKQSLHGTEK